MTIFVWWVMILAPRRSHAMFTPWRRCCRPPGGHRRRWPDMSSWPSHTVITPRCWASARTPSCCELPVPSCESSVDAAATPATSVSRRAITSSRWPWRNTTCYQRSRRLAPRRSSWPTVSRADVRPRSWPGDGPSPWRSCWPHTCHSDGSTRDGDSTHDILHARCKDLMVPCGTGLHAGRGTTGDGALFRRIPAVDQSENPAGSTSSAHKLRIGVSARFRCGRRPGRGGVRPTIRWVTPRRDHTSRSGKGRVRGGPTCRPTPGSTIRPERATRPSWHGAQVEELAAPPSSAPRVRRGILSHA